MAMNLVFLVVTAFVFQGVVVDSSGRVYVDPEEHAKEERAVELLRDANAYHNMGWDADRNVAIEKYETVLREVDLLPKLRQDILFKVAELYRLEGQYLVLGGTDQTDAKVALGKSDLERASTYYTEVLSAGLGERRPGLLAESLLGMGDIRLTLRKNEEAVQYYAQARKIALDESLSSEEGLAPERRRSIAEIALSRTMNALQQDLRARVREDMASQNTNDADLVRALTGPPDGGAGRRADAVLQTQREGPGQGPASPSHGSWRLQVVVALASGTFTVGLIVVMRKRLQRGRERNPNPAAAREGRK
jgi:tetratricopeptide (TPR) repeat protein